MGVLRAGLPGDKGQIEIVDEPLGKGGEGSVYKVVSHDLSSLPDADELVAKIYHAPHEENRAAKVKAMIMSPPDSDSVAWPLAAVMGKDGFVGYLMKKLDFSQYRPWADLAHTASRRKTSRSFDVMYAVTAVRNFASALESVHDAGHYIGDINESNMFVSTDARVFLVDTDSAQIKDPKSGTVYPCAVGKPEYTASEISKGSLKNHTRTKATDTFGFAVAAYQMILGGPHPSDGIYKGEDEAPSVPEKIRSGIFPGLDAANAQGMTLPPRIAIGGVPSAVRSLLLEALSPDPEKRPELSSVISVFDEVSDHLQQCSAVEQHWYDARDGGKCPWCAHAEKTGIDPWAAEQKEPKKPQSSQRALPNVNFSQDDGSQKKAKRLPPQRAGANNRVQPQAPGAAAAAPQQSAPPASYGGQQAPSPHPSGAGMPMQQPPMQQGPYAGYPGMQQPPYPYGYQQPPMQEPTQKELKKRFKTKKTVLKYADGSYRPRPPIGELMTSSPKTAIRCLKDEAPGFAVFWWSQSRNLAVPWALLIGWLLALGSSHVWLYNFPHWLAMMADHFEWGWGWLDIVWMVFAYTAFFGVIFTSSWLTMSGSYDRWKTKRRNGGSVEGFAEEKWWRTALRYVGISIVYGPILCIWIVLGLVWLLAMMLLALIPSSRHI